MFHKETQYIKVEFYQKAHLHLHARTAPIGILRSVDAQRISDDVAAGDVIIMLSDGIIPGEEEVFRLTEALTDSASLSPKEIADKLLALAIEPDKPAPDDCSVLVARITAA